MVGIDHVDSALLGVVIVLSKVVVIEGYEMALVVDCMSLVAPALTGPEILKYPELKKLWVAFLQLRKYPTSYDDEKKPMSTATNSEYWTFETLLLIAVIVSLISS